MDKINYLKKIFKTIIIALVVIANFMLFSLISEKASKELYLRVFNILGVILVFVIIIYYILKFKLMKQNTKGYLNIKDFNRDILKDYPPAIYSFLYNKKIDAYADFTATILNLEYKNYLKVNNDGYDIEILKSELNELSEHEIYVMNCIMKNTKFNTSEFNRSIITDLLKLNLIELIDKNENKKKSNNKKTVPILGNIIVQAVLILIVVFLILHLIVLNIKVTSTVLLIGVAILGVIAYIRDTFLIGIYVVNGKEKKKIKFTKKGKEIRENVFELKKYLRDCTINNKKDIKYEDLLYNYIAYALTVGESKFVEDFVSKNEKYRDLIYRNKEVL